MTPRYVLDTNVLVYAFDSSEPAKQERAVEILSHLGRSDGDGPLAAIPAQALAEFARVSMQKLRPPLPADAARTQIELYEQVFPVLPLTAAVVREAIRGVRDHRFAYFDAQIWAVARLHGIPTVLSEDFATGSAVGNVAFRNPFEATFAW